MGAVVKLKQSKSSDPDNIYPWVLSKAKEGVLLPFYLIFQQSLNTGIVPAAWKEANVIALYKKGNRCTPSIYHLVSLTPVVCKMLEAIIKEELVKYFDHAKLLSNSQHIFWPEHSCVTTQLIK